jgi:hypothetical protein
MQQMIQPKFADEYKTTDLGIAAFLLAKQLPLLRVDDSEKRVLFVFPGGAAELANRFYWPGANLVDARRFHLSLRELRGLTRRKE